MKKKSKFEELLEKYLPWKLYRDEMKIGEFQQQVLGLSDKHVEEWNNGIDKLTKEDIDKIAASQSRYCHECGREYDNEEEKNKN